MVKRVSCPVVEFYLQKITKRVSGKIEEEEPKPSKQRVGAESADIKIISDIEKGKLQS